MIFLSLYHYSGLHNHSFDLRITERCRDEKTKERDEVFTAVWFIRSTKILFEKAIQVREPENSEFSEKNALVFTSPMGPF